MIEGICHRPFHPHRLFSGMLLLVFPILQGRTCYRVYRKSDAQSSSSPQVKEMTRESSVGLLQLILFCYFICYPLCQENTGKGDGSLHLLCFWTHVPSLPNHCYFLCHSLCVCVLQYWETSLPPKKKPSHQSPCPLHMGHFAQIPRFLAAGKVPLAKHIPRDPGTKDALSSPSAPTPTGDPAAEEWSPWSVCSTTCGEGWQTRTRFCVSSSYSTQCSGPLREQRQCNNSAVCPGGLSAPCTHGQEGKGGSWSTNSSGHLLHDIFLEGGFFFPAFPSLLTLIVSQRDH